MSLPELRQDLRIYQGADSRSGAPTWTIYDPSKETYFQVGQLEVEILSRWHLKDPHLIASKVCQQTAFRQDAEDVLKLAKFLISNGLVYNPPNEMPKTKTATLKQLVDRIVFIRIPLIRPQAFLSRSISYLQWVFTPLFLKVVLAFGVIGIYLVSRQWDAYVHQFSYMLTFEGMLIGLLALSVSKICHELGHAYAATRAGVPVPEMGVSLIVFWPLLYTNTTHAWQVRDRRLRIAIDAAGVITELILAVFFTFLWCVLPEGALRGAVWYLSSTAWIVTLGFNLNPLMRFDGYYLLSDFMNVPNLMARSMALSRWWLRSTVLGVSEASPERVTKSLRRFMLTYGIACISYRFLVLATIIVVIYHLFFKVLAIALALAASWYYIGMPLWRELVGLRSHWRGLVQRMLAHRSFWLSVAVMAIILLPLPTKVRVPAVLVSAEDARIYSPAKARIQEVMVKEGGIVKKGQILLRLSSPELEYKHRLANIKAKALSVELSRQPAAMKLRENHQVLIQQYAEVLAEIAGLDSQLYQLLLRAPHDGAVFDLNDQIKVDAWINPRNLLMRVVGSGLMIEGYVEEKSTLSSGGLGRMYPEQMGMSTFVVKVLSVDTMRTVRIDRPALASLEGGSIDAQRNDRGDLIAHGAIYRVRALPVSDISAPKTVLRGEVAFDGPWESQLLVLLKRLISLVVRESSF